MRSVFFIMLCVFLAAPASAADREKMTEDKQQVRIWNKFAENLYELHKKQLKEHEVETKSKIGGYMNMPKYYEAVTYIDSKTKKVLSRILWEREQDNRDFNSIHVIQVYFYDDKGRVIRDYSAAYLPGARNAPNQTLVSLHHYSNGLHGFRNYNAFGERIYEACQGTYKGEEVDISLEDFEIFEISRDPTGLMTEPVYHECFGKLPDDTTKQSKKYVK